MNDRTAKILVKIIAIAGSTGAALSVVLFGGLKNVFVRLLLATLAGTAGHFAFHWLGSRLARQVQRWRLASPGKPVYAFGELPPEEAENAGGKGRVLAKLFQAGFPVPDGCILLPCAFEADTLTDQAWEMIKRQLSRLRRGKSVSFAVRSSALSEDSAQASFAGEFESVLDVGSDEEIREAVAKVIGSRHSARVQSYSQAKGFAAGEHPIAVILQKLVRADISGVLFTADPLIGDLMQMTGNFVAGMGDRLVSGEVSASAFTFTRTVGTYSGPPELLAVAKTLHSEAHEIEHQMGRPQDIEWAVSGKKLFILQSRPITTLNGDDPVTAEWNDTLKGNFLWSATNLMEASPEVLTPFTASLRLYLESKGGPSLTVKGYPLNGLIGGRFYANLSVQVTAFVHAFKGDAHRAYREIAGWWGEIPEDMQIPLLPLTKQEWQREMLPSLLRTSRMFTRYRKQAPEFLKRSRRRFADMREKIDQTTTGANLLSLWAEDISPAYVEAMNHIVAAGSDAQVRLERDLRKLVGAEDARALLSNLGGASGQLESLGPVAGLGMVLRGEMTREIYLENYGHRGENEGECAWPRPAENPHWLDQQLEQWRRNPVDVEAMLARQREAYQAAWNRLCQKAPGRAKSLKKRLDQAARAAQMRERVRSEATRGVTVLRAFALRAGDILGIGEGVFFLTINEVLAALAGEVVTFPHLRIRQEVYQRYRALPPYPAVICGRFDPFAWAADPNRRSDVFDSRSQAAPLPGASPNTLRGAPGALGVVEGTVRRLICLEESEQFQSGEVLVTTMINIGWTPLFPRAAAIVTDLGAPLSHATIVARELGVPAVVGCGNATMFLKTGDRVRVDGGKGQVEILARTGQE